jgi:nucleoside-diphosphate-sugar epimerase
MTARRVLVTGASGFLGAALITDLIDFGFDVQGVSRQSRVAGSGLTWVVADLTDSTTLSDLVRNVDVVINGAAKTLNSDQSRNPAAFYGINRDAVVSLFRDAERAGVKVFVQISSTGVFGPGSGEFDEESPCRPTNLYEQSKFAAESALRQVAKNARMRLVIARPSNVFGEGHPRRKLLTWLRSVNQGRAVLPANTANYWTNYIYLSDVTRAIAAIANMTLKSTAMSAPDIYNLNCPVTAQQFLEASAYGLGIATKAYKIPKPALLALGIACDAVSAVVGRQLPMTRDKGRELTNRQIFIADRATKVLPGFPWIGLHDGMRRICEYYRAKGLL